MSKKQKKTAPDKEKNKSKAKKSAPEKDPAVAKEETTEAKSVESTATEENAATEETLSEMNDKYLRLMAEYDNYRKRTLREREDIIKSAAEDIIKELLPILDNLDRATEHRKNNETLDEYVEGIALIEEQFRRVLSRSGLEVMEVEGKAFDPEIHDAIMQMESPDHDPNTIINEVEKGYILSGKVIRHPKVVVSK